MKPVKGTIPFAKWLLRLAPLFIIYLISFKVIKTWNFSDINYLILLGLAVFSVLLIIGGFTRKHSLTVISGLLIFILGIIQLILNLDNAASISFALIFIIIGFFFVSNGNKTT